MTKQKNFCLILWKFLTEYYYLLMYFHQELAPIRPTLSPDPRYLQSCQELPYVVFFLMYMELDPLGFLEVAQQYGLLTKLAQTLDMYDQEGGANAA